MAFGRMKTSVCLTPCMGSRGPPLLLIQRRACLLLVATPPRKSTSEGLQVTLSPGSPAASEHPSTLALLPRLGTHPLPRILDPREPASWGDSSSSFFSTSSSSAC